MKRKGFTLVELAVVITIISIIMCALTVGKYLINMANIRGVYYDVTQLKQSISMFRERYGYWPGDLPNATTHLGATGVTNGNGDEIIVWDTETLQAHVHLYYASLFPVLYYGYAYGAVPYFIAGKNFIPGRYPGSGYFTRTLPGQSGVNYDTNLVYNRDGTFVEFSAVTTAGTAHFAAAISPRQAYALDTKFDDGVPSSGLIYADLGTNITAVSGGDGVCTSAGPTSATSASYILTNTIVACRMFFWLFPASDVNQ